MDEVRDGIAPRIQLVTTEVRVVPVVQGAELLGRRLAGGARPDGGPGIPDELHRHVARGVVADLARRPGTEPTVQRSVWQGVDDALESPRPDDRNCAPSPNATTSGGVVAKMKIHPSSATRLGTG